MKSIKDTFLFKMQDKASSLKDKMTSYNPSLDNIDLDMLEEPLNVISKRFNYPAKNIILHELNNSIVPIYNKDRVSLPSYIPAYLYNNRVNSSINQVIAIVNLTNYAKYNKTANALDIEPQKLFSQLQCGEILLTCFYKWNSISMSQSICKLSSLIYSRLFVKILDRMFAVNFDPIKADKIKFIVSKFFLLNLLEKTSSGDVINNMAYANCTNGTTKNTISVFSDSLNPVIYNDFACLIQQLALSIEGMGGITVRTFIDTTVQMYGSTFLLAFEYFPFFLYNVFGVVTGANINKEFVLENVIGKEADRLYTEFVSLMRKV